MEGPAQRRHSLTFFDAAVRPVLAEIPCRSTVESSREVKVADKVDHVVRNANEGYVLDLFGAAEANVNDIGALVANAL